MFVAQVVTFSLAFGTGQPDATLVPEGDGPAAADGWRPKCDAIPLEKAPSDSSIRFDALPAPLQKHFSRTAKAVGLEGAQLLGPLQMHYVKAGFAQDEFAPIAESLRGLTNAPYPKLKVPNGLVLYLDPVCSHCAATWRVFTQLRTQCPSLPAADVILLPAKTDRSQAVAALVTAARNKGVKAFEDALTSIFEANAQTESEALKVLLERKILSDKPSVREKIGAIKAIAKRRRALRLGDLEAPFLTFRGRLVDRTRAKVNGVLRKFNPRSGPVQMYTTLVSAEASWRADTKNN